MDFAPLVKYLSPQIITYYKDLKPSDLASVLWDVYMETRTQQLQYAPSAVIGQHGEDYVLNILNYDVDVTAKKAFSTDLVINSRYGIIMIEVKNYTRTVPTKEIEKFRRDVSVNKNIIGGIFISIGSAITSKGLISFENLWTDQPLLIYLATDDKDIINDSVRLVENYVDKQMTKNLKKERLYTIFSAISDHNNQLLLATKLIAETKIVIIKNLDNVQQLVNTTEMNIRRLLRESSTVLLEQVQPSVSDLINIDNLDKIAIGVLHDNVYEEFLRSILLYISDTITLIIKYNKKEIIFMDDVVCKVKPLKTKMILSLKVEHPIPIPINASYKNNWVIFDIVKKTMNRQEIFDTIDTIKSYSENNSNDSNGDTSSPLMANRE